MVSELIKNIILDYTPRRLKAIYVNNVIKKHQDQIALLEEYATYSYSQEGEDLILKRFMEDIRNGFYIDIGAHHPKRFSNTFMFYKLGWRGINIDPLPGTKILFDKERPRDLNLEIGVSNVTSKLKYYMFNEPALNTFSQSEALKKNGLSNYYITHTTDINTHPLSEILNKHLPENQVINFMSIDVEGLDLLVLKSNDWDRFRPEYLLVEDLERRPVKDLFDSSPLIDFTTSINYTIVAKSFNTIIFKDLLD